MLEQETNCAKKIKNKKKLDSNLISFDKINYGNEKLNYGS